MKRLLTIISIAYTMVASATIVTNEVMLYNHNTGTIMEPGLTAIKSVSDSRYLPLSFGAVETNWVLGKISATDSTFSNAVMGVALNIDTNVVAVLGEIASNFGGFPLDAGETATTVGGLLLAMAAAIAWLKKKTIKTSSENEQQIRSDLTVYGDVTTTKLTSETLAVGSLTVGGTRVEVVDEMPQSPVNDTLYFIKEPNSGSAV